MVVGALRCSRRLLESQTRSQREQRAQPPEACYAVGSAPPLLYLLATVCDDSTRLTRLDCFASFEASETLKSSISVFEYRSNRYCHKTTRALPRFFITNLQTIQPFHRMFHKLQIPYHSSFHDGQKNDSSARYPWISPV